MTGFLSAAQRQMLEVMDVQLWELRKPPAVAERAVPQNAIPERAIPEITAPGIPVAETPSKKSQSVSPLGWSELADTVAACTRCELHQTRTQTVFGVGDPAADWMIIGEAPGADEDRQGEPFVGKAGQLLDEMLRAVGLDRSRVFIANILKCRPPNNRDPKPEEVEACSDFLQQQIAEVKPKLIVAVGRIAAQNLLHSDKPVGQLRGKVHEVGASRIPVVVTYHPAYLLRSPGQKRKTWDDLCLARATIAGVKA
ncbi:MAG: uracil-DNA glycosylase [Gammaproteobacteria bacterium]|nr:uracil-DNA glycosylase [Gammaproteobacteria bacterium]